MPGELVPTMAASGNGVVKSKAPEHSPDLYLISEEDTIYEQDILRDAASVKPWLAYVEVKMRHGTLLEQAYVLERAVTVLPRSYKLWKMYLDLRVKHLAGMNPAIHFPQFAKVNCLFERSLILLNKMPRIWESYLSFLMLQPLFTQLRLTFDRALRALPITQHDRIWALYRPFAKSASGMTAVKVYRRYMQVHPEEAEDFIELLITTKHYTEAAKQYLRVLNDPRFKSRGGKSQFQLWTDMVEFLVTYAREIDADDGVGLDVEGIVRSGIDRFADQRGKLWTGLANYWITKGDFDRARDVFEEGITTAMTVRDFTLVYESYVEFEESIVGNLMSAATARMDAGAPDEDADEDLDIRMMRFERLMDRRAFLVNNVLLRQNPNNVIEWQKRVALWEESSEEVVKTYTDAIAAIDPKKAVGKFEEIWVNYAKFYEKAGDWRNAELIMSKACKVPFKSVGELAEVYIARAEMHLRRKDMGRALRSMEEAIISPKRSKVDYFDDSLTPQQRLHKSWKVWSFYADLMESGAPLQEVMQVYERIFELRIATPQTVVNYARFLEENEYYEESFKIYERGLDLFSYPVAFEIWNIYLTKAMDRELHMDRLRDLFEQATEGCPPKFAKTLYLMYGDLEEKRGLTRSAMRIYERALFEVAEEDRKYMFEYYINHLVANLGLSACRPVYEMAITTLRDKEATDMCLKFADLETRLGEVDRARNIYGYGSQFCDPRTSQEFWAKWEAFEVRHGNEDTFKEMLRVKRSVRAQYNTDLGLLVSRALGAGDDATKDGQDGGADDGTASPTADAMAALERQARAPVGFVAASTGLEGSKLAVRDKDVTPTQANPDALELDGMDDE
ncbi:MAG: pre-mRNA-splicing factor syf1 [Thelocarpon impressellum]|nr:MAG: pre-mRNA-splicing factor syf1 [Thelocarpon impressellum]